MRIYERFPPFHRKPGEWDEWLATPWSLAGQVAVWPFYH